MVKPKVEKVITGVSAMTPERDARLSNATSATLSHRSEASRDADRVLYSAAWRRLAGVTQVVTPFEGQATLHNRLTHSEKVAQVARAIAANLLQSPATRAILQSLGGFSVDVCHAASLAHDLGHAPFGHIGEHALDEYAREHLGLADGFEGNAQTMRIITTRRTRSSLYEGFDFTRASLAAVAKYPWVRREKLTDDAAHEEALESDPDYRREWNKFNVYHEQAEILVDARSFLPSNFGSKTQSLEASVMDTADDITYAIHDLEDSYLSGMLDVARVLADLDACIEQFNKPNAANPFTQLRRKLSLDYPESWVTDADFYEALKMANSLLRVRMEFANGGQSTDGESAVRAELSNAISKFITAVDVKPSVLWANGPYLGLPRPEWHQIQVLKHVTKNYVISAPDVAILQFGQEKILVELISMLRDWAKRDGSRLPRALREELQIAKDLIKDPSSRGYGVGKFVDRGDPNRAFLDYLCMLTDTQCVTLHEKLSGRRPHRAVVGDGY